MTTVRRSLYRHTCQWSIRVHKPRLVKSQALLLPASIGALLLFRASGGSTRQAPTPAHWYTLIRFRRLRTKLKLVDLQRTKQHALRQGERDLRRACWAQVRIATSERAPERRGAARRRDGVEIAGSGRGGRGEGPAQRATRRNVHPLATARRTCTRRAHRAGTEIKLHAVCQLRLRTAVVGDEVRGASREWYLHLDLRCCCKRWSCTRLAF
jgi:hypothetical protein